jgi:hypothetical protein
MIPLTPTEFQVLRRLPVGEPFFASKLAAAERVSPVWLLRGLEGLALKAVVLDLGEERGGRGWYQVPAGGTARAYDAAAEFEETFGFPLADVTDPWDHWLRIPELLAAADCATFEAFLLLCSSDQAKLLRGLFGCFYPQIPAAPPRSFGSLL